MDLNKRTVSSTDINRGFFFLIMERFILHKKEFDTNYCMKTNVENCNVRKILKRCHNLFPKGRIRNKNIVPFNKCKIHLI